MKIETLFHSSNGRDFYGHVCRLRVINADQAVFDFVNSHDHTTVFRGMYAHHHLVPYEIYVRFSDYSDMLEFKFLFLDYFT